MKIFFALMLAFAITACASSKSVQQTAMNSLAGVESAYGVAQSAALAYMAQPTCPAGGSITLTSVCKDPATVRAIAKQDQVVTQLLVKAGQLVKSDPMNAQSAIDSAQAGVDAMKALLPKG